MPAIKNWETNAEEALKHVQARYKSLSVYGTQLNALVKETGKPLSVSILSLYNEACNDHLSFANKVFYLFHQNKMQIEQVVMTEGKYAVGPNGNVRTVRIEAPLQPPFLPHQAGATPRIGQAPVQPTTVGIAPLVIAGFIVLGALVINSFGYVGIKVLEKINMLFQDGPNWDPDHQLDLYLKCVDSLKAKGFSAEEAKTIGCQKLLDYTPSGTKWGMIILSVAAIGAGVYLIPKFTDKG